MTAPVINATETYEDFDHILAFLGFGGMSALATANEPWRIADMAAPEASVSGARPKFRYVMAGAVALMGAAAPPVGGSGPAADASSRGVPGGATSALAVYVVPAGRREDENDLAAATAVAPMAPVPAVAITAGAQVGTVQSALGLSVTEIARILGVSRATIHGWLRGDIRVPHKAETQQRLLDLTRLAQAWAALSASPLDALARAVVTLEGASLLTLLEAPAWDRSAIDGVLQQLATVFASADEVRARMRPVRVGTMEATAEDIADAERARNRRALQRARTLRHRG